MQVYTDGSFDALELDFRNNKADVQGFWESLQYKLLIPPPPPPCVECKGIGCTFCEREDTDDEEEDGGANDDQLKQMGNGGEDDEKGQKSPPIAIVKKAPARSVISVSLCAVHSPVLFFARICVRAYRSLAGSNVFVCLCMRVDGYKNKYMYGCTRTQIGAQRATSTTRKRRICRRTL